MSIYFLKLQLTYKIMLLSGDSMCIYVNEMNSTINRHEFSDAIDITMKETEAIEEMHEISKTVHSQKRAQNQGLSLGCFNLYF